MGVASGKVHSSNFNVQEILSGIQQNICLKHQFLNAGSVSSKQCVSSQRRRRKGRCNSGAVPEIILLAGWVANVFVSVVWKEQWEKYAPRWGPICSGGEGGKTSTYTLVLAGGV